MLQNRCRKLIRFFPDFLRADSQWTKDLFDFPGMDKQWTQIVYFANPWPDLFNPSRVEFADRLTPGFTRSYSNWIPPGLMGWGSGSGFMHSSDWEFNIIRFGVQELMLWFRFHDLSGIWCGVLRLGDLSGIWCGVLRLGDLSGIWWCEILDRELTWCEIPDPRLMGITKLRRGFCVAWWNSSGFSPTDDDFR